MDIHWRALTVAPVLAIVVAGCSGAPTAPSLDVASIALNTPPVIYIGETTPLTATATLADGSIRDLSSSVMWTSYAARVATVSPAGIVTGASGGTVTVTATYRGTVGAADVTVFPAAIDASSTLRATIGGASFTPQTLTAIKSLWRSPTESLTRRSKRPGARPR